MSRRGENIYKRKDGRFEGRVPVGYRENGSIKYKSVYARALAEVKQKMADLYAVGQEKPVSTLKLIVKEAAEQWLISAKLRVKPYSFGFVGNMFIHTCRNQENIEKKLNLYKSLSVERLFFYSRRR